VPAGAAPLRLQTRRRASDAAAAKPVPAASAPCSSGRCSPAPAAAKPAAAPSGGRIFASPLAKRIAAEKGLESFPNIKGSGPNGRIVKADVEAAKPGAAPAAAPVAAGAPKAAPPPVGQPVFVAPGDTPRAAHLHPAKVIARAHAESKQTVPHFYLTVDL